MRCLTASMRILWRGDNAYYLIHMDSTFDEAAYADQEMRAFWSRKQDAYTNWVDGLKGLLRSLRTMIIFQKLTFERVFKIKEDTL